MLLKNSNRKKTVQVVRVRILQGFLIISQVQNYVQSKKIGTNIILVPIFFD